MRFIQTRNTLTAALALTTALPAMAQEVNVYSYRQPELIQPLMDAFTEETGIAVNVALAEGEAQAREALQDELEKRSRQALVATIDEMQNAVESSSREKRPCQSRLVPASYRIIVENTGAERLRDIAVGIADTQTIYEPISPSVSLKPGQQLSFITMVEPKLRDVWDRRFTRLEPDATNQNWRHWFNNVLAETPTSIKVTLPGPRQCLGSCINTKREAHVTAPQSLADPYQWAL